MKEIVKIKNIVKLQRHVIYDGVHKSMPILDPSKNWNDTNWREVPLKKLKAINGKNCPPEK